MPAALPARLISQNPGRVDVSPVRREIKTHIVGQEGAFVFCLYQGEWASGSWGSLSLPGVPYQIRAFEEETPLFTVGYLDYRFVSESLTMMMDLHHGNIFPKAREAIRVEKLTRNRFRGLGRSMMSISLSHALSAGMETVFFCDVIDGGAQAFLERLSEDVRVVEAIHDETGAVPVDEADPDDEDQTVSMQLDLASARNIPQVLISLRSQPIAEVLAER